MLISPVYPLVICYIAIENGPVEIVDFPINSMVSFHSYVKLPEGTGTVAGRNLKYQLIYRGYPIVYIKVEKPSEFGGGSDFATIHSL